MIIRIGGLIMIILIICNPVDPSVARTHHSSFVRNVLRIRVDAERHSGLLQRFTLFRETTSSAINSSEKATGNCPCSTHFHEHVRE